MVGYIVIIFMAIMVGALLAFLLDSIFVAGMVGFIVGVIVTAVIVAWTEDERGS